MSKLNIMFQNTTLKKISENIYFQSIYPLYKNLLKNVQSNLEEKFPVMFSYCHWTDMLSLNIECLTRFRFTVGRPKFLNKISFNFTVDCISSDESSVK